LCQAVGLPLVEVRNHANLAEAYAQMEQLTVAQAHWRAGYTISQAGRFDDEIAVLTQLAADFPALRACAQDAPAPQSVDPPARLTEWSAEEQAILDLVERLGQVTPKVLMEALRVSKATATRRLAELVEQGVLVQHGRGRGTHYKRRAAVKLPNAQPDQPEQTLSAQIVSTLHQQETLLRANYALCALGLVAAQEAAPDRAVLVELVVRFSCQPDLRTFFALEQELGTLIQKRIDLLPIDLVDTTALPTGVVWIWS
jgi:DNA-binding Lrp family transcriptional regulator